jgi:hypothetical protein
LVLRCSPDQNSPVDLPVGQDYSFLMYGPGLFSGVGSYMVEAQSLQ